MGAPLVDVANAVAAELNEDPLTNFGVTFTAERNYPDFKVPLKDLDALHVDVIPVRNTQTALDRGGNVNNECLIRIAFRKRFGRDAQTGRLPADEIDVLVDALTRVYTYFWGESCDGNGLSTMSSATMVPAEGGVMMAYIEDHFHEMNQYTGLTEVTFEVQTT